MQIQKGTTSKSVFVNIWATAGGKLSGLVYNSAGLTAYYTRQGAAEAAITLATQTVTGAYSSGGFVEIGATNSKGLYRLDIPDAALAAGADHVVICLRGASGMEQCDLLIELTDPVAVRGKFVTGTLTAQTSTTNLTHGNDKLNGRRGLVVSGTLAGEEFWVGDYAQTNGQIWFAVPLSGAPSNNDEFVLL